MQAPSAISVLTDAKHFQGSLAHLAAIREALPDGPPLLRKDFIFDEYQVYEARCSGADAILLITAILEPRCLPNLLALLHRWAWTPSSKSTTNMRSNER